jgi:hypothetical protein
LRVLLFALLAAVPTLCEPQPPVPLHAEEPIVIGDGSVKVDVYSTTGKDSRVDGDTVIARGFPDNQATFSVPVGVVMNDGKAQLKTTSGLAHPALRIDGYIYEIERFTGKRFVPYAHLSFTLKKESWIIAPGGANPLKLIRSGEPVALSGAWANHFLTTYEFGHPGAVLRVGAVSIMRHGSRTTRIRLGTGCSEFRIEPTSHIRHDMPFDNPPCHDSQLLRAGSRYPTVRINGVKPVTAIDVSAALAQARQSHSSSR